ncbi:MAG: hypothetical protein R2991_11260 [Thermoanaerobaculia bacterium]
MRNRTSSRTPPNAGLAGRALLVAATLASVSLWPPRLQAQESRTFYWEAPRTVCTDGGPGSDRLLYLDGAYRIPTDQYPRRCSLRLTWTTNRPPAGFDVSREAVVERRGEVVDDAGRSRGGVGSFRDQNTVVAEIPLRQLPSATLRLGLRVRRANGEVHVSNPHSGPSVRAAPPVEPPRITSFRIDGGASRTSDPTLRLDLTTTGAQPAEIMIGERPGPGFAGAHWQPYAPTTGAFGGIQTYTLHDRGAGRKTIHVKVRSGGLESESVFDAIDFRPLETIRVPSAEALDLAAREGFRHTAAERAPGGYCLVGVAENRPNMPRGADLAATTSCEFSLFEGRRLADGWSVVTMTLSGRTGRMTVRRRPSGSDPHLVVQLVGGRSHVFVDETAYRSLTITLQGPEGADWRDAFRR